jgi:adenylate cyclase
LGLGVLALVLLMGIHLDQARLPGVRLVEAGARDGLMQLMARTTEDPRLAIVDINEDSLRKLGPWPWPRQRLADLAEQLLSEAGAHRVVFDLVLPSPGEDAGGEATGDARLAALARAGVLVVGQALDYERRSAAVEAGWLGGGQLDRPEMAAAQATGYVGNFKALAEGRCIGNIGFVPDFDGQTRRLAPWTVWEGRHFPSLAMAALACTRDTAATQPVVALPQTPEGWWRVPFRHLPQAHMAVPAHEVLAGTVDAAGGAPFLAGRIVMVGSSALGLADRVATPVSPNVSGVTVHVEALSWLLDAAEGRTPSPPPGGLMLGWALISGLLLAWAVGSASSSLVRVGVALLGVVLAWGALAAWVTATGATQPISTPLLAYGLVMLVQLPLEWAGAQGRVRRQARLLGRYVAPSVLERLQRSASTDALAPRRAHITVLIADMQDYTRNTADVELAEAARLTKGFLQALTEPVLQARGTLDRYTGDGLVAFWGAPIAEEDHADLAVDAALAIVDQVARFNQQRLAQGLQAVHVRMGLASGEALVGDLGTRFRIAYTAVGDCINLASRLQQASRELDVSILAADSVRLACKRHRFEPLGVLPVRGLSAQPVATPSVLRASLQDAEGGPAGG